MDISISAIMGAIVFAAFVLGLAQSIGSLPFILIVVFVVGLMAFDTVQVIKEARISEKFKSSSK